MMYPCNYFNCEELLILKWLSFEELMINTGISHEKECPNSFHKMHIVLIFTLQPAKPKFTAIIKAIMNNA